MFSVLLLHPTAHPTALADLYHNATRLQWIIARYNGPVYFHSALLDQPFGFGVRLRQPTFHHRFDETDWKSSLEFRDFFGHLTFAKLGLEVGLGSGGCLFPMQPFHQLACERSLGVAWFHRQNRIELPTFEAGNQPQGLLDQPVGERHR